MGEHPDHKPEVPDNVPSWVPVWHEVWVGSKHVFEQKRHTLKAYNETWCAQEGVELLARARFSSVTIGAKKTERVGKGRSLAFPSYGSNLRAIGPVLVVVDEPYRYVPETVKKS